MVALLALALVVAAFVVFSYGYDRTAIALFLLACWLFSEAPVDDDESLWGALVIVMAVGLVSYWLLS